MRSSAILPIVLMAGAVVYTYWGVLTKLVHDWGANEDYSHGFLIVPLSLYFVWERRARLRATPLSPASIGLLGVLAGLGGLAVGTLGAELFVSRLSLIVLLAGIVLFAAGWTFLRILAFPLAFLLLMIPLPMIIFNQVAFPLQLLASRVGETVLWSAGIPVLREGNIITLANTSLEVAEACSGIRSLVSLLTLTIVYSQFAESRRRLRVLLVLATIPIAILTNGIRVAAIGVAAHFSGPDAAEGLFHTVSGWLVFVAAFALLLLLHRATGLAFGPRQGAIVAAGPSPLPLTIPEDPERC